MRWANITWSGPQMAPEPHFVHDCFTQLYRTNVWWRTILLSDVRSCCAPLCCWFYLYGECFNVFRRLLSNPIWASAHFASWLTARDSWHRSLVISSQKSPKVNISDVAVHCVHSVGSSSQVILTIHVHCQTFYILQMDTVCWERWSSLS